MEHSSRQYAASPKSRLEDWPAVHESAVAIVPPEEIWEQIQRARMEAQDAGMFRWPPHMNILYPFFEVDKFKYAAPLLAEATAKFEPFTVTLQNFRKFERKRQTTLWLEPTVIIDDRHDNENIFQSLHTALRDSLPLKQQRRGPFTAHLTVSQFDTVEEANAMIEQLEQWWEPVTFAVTELHMISRKGPRAQFELQYRLPLMGGAEKENNDNGTPGSLINANKELEVEEQLFSTYLEERRKYIGMPEEQLPFTIRRNHNVQPNWKMKKQNEQTRMCSEERKLEKKQAAGENKTI